ncbi:MAG: restriction endonuclease subunit S, partial [Methanomethylovorans sp.]|nr:restriction endonuclease subunit S [Methanomethylovorans sp.]
MVNEARALADKGWLYHPDYPDHWERCSLYSLAEWVNGLAFRDIQFSASGLPVIKIAEIKGGISGQTKFTQQTFDESVRVRPGDLLFSWSGQPETSIDAFWWRGPEGWLNQHVFRVTPADGIDPTFFYYLLRYLKPNFVGIARNKQTTGLGHVTKRDLQNIEAAYPELPEQRAIAHILGTLDDKIELNRRMSETLEAMARALFKSWFVDFEPVRAKMEGRWDRGQSLPGLPAYLYDLFPDRLVDSELGEIPEGWGVVSLPDMVEINPTRPLRKGAIAPYLDMANMPTRGHAP